MVHTATMRFDLELAIGVLNGTIGDYLERRGNGLATPMQILSDGRPLDLTGEAAVPLSGTKIALFVHGLMSTEGVWEIEGGDSYGARLARDHGYLPLFLRYNSGRHISDNGESLDLLLEKLVAGWPVPIDELTLVGHSMGGLVIRSATHVASNRDAAWLGLVRKAYYVGTPHLGAPLEKFGNVLTYALKKIGDPYTKLIGDIIALRSSGVKDLRYANLRREDWEGADADALLENRRHPVPLLPQIRHHLVAGTLSADPRLAMLFGDAMVPVRSATGRAEPKDKSPAFPETHVRILPSLDHVSLAHDDRVYEVLKAWFEETA